MGIDTCQFLIHMDFRIKQTSFFFPTESHYEAQADLNLLFFCLSLLGAGIIMWTSDVCVCACRVCTCVHVCLQVHTYTSVVGQKLTSGIFLDWPSPWLLRQGLSLNLALTDWMARLVVLCPRGSLSLQPFAPGYSWMWPHFDFFFNLKLSYYFSFETSTLCSPGCPGIWHQASLILSVWVFCLHVYACTTCVSGIHKV